MFLLNERSLKALDHLNNLSILLKGEKTLRHWTINDLLLFFLKEVIKLCVDFRLSLEIYV